MLNSVREQCSVLCRRFHSLPSQVALKKKPLSVDTEETAILARYQENIMERFSKPKDRPVIQHVKRNELGVQLLSRNLRSQLFRDVSFPAPSQSYVHIAREHLELHGLDPTQASVLPDTNFPLPPLQGRNLDEHFHRIGLHAAKPWLTLANDFSTSELPPKPDHWHIQSGWTKYYYKSDGSSYSEHVDSPEHNGHADEMLTFDVETMPKYHSYAVMACAASKNAWYSWISPWLLNESSDPQHLIPLGDANSPQVIIGHNVSYDRGRVLEEYNLRQTKRRFIDTMALHVAVNGISSHQRPAWIQYRKAKQKEQELLQTEDSDVVEAEITAKRWEDLTSANSLADVAKLHCNISVAKEIRNDFMTHTPSDIRDNIHDYLDYCSTDVFVTHAVFSKVLPAFFAACPSPVSFAGILTMGSSFLTVNESWEAYLEMAERTYKELDVKIKKRLRDLAEEAKAMMDSGEWKNDVWLSQLDWTPKTARVVNLRNDAQVPSEPNSSSASRPTWYHELLTLGPLSRGVVERILPLLLNVSYEGHTMQYSSSEKWHFELDGKLARIRSAGKSKTMHLLGATHGLPYLKNGCMAARDVDLAIAIASGDRSDSLGSRILELAKQTLDIDQSRVETDPWLKQLDWTPVSIIDDVSYPPRSKPTTRQHPEKQPPVLWPKWYWDQTKPRKDMPRGTLDVTVRNRIAPILLRLSWLGWPLFHSREHGWTFRVPNNVNFTTRLNALDFYDPADDALQESSLRGGFVFYKLPHKDGEKANVGSPLGKTFIKFAQDGTLTSPGNDARDALDMNAQCSYWISARDRILNQMVVWQNDRMDMGFKQPSEDNGEKDASMNAKKWGIILPQVITMGTVTRRAIEKTWLTASNAKKNRVGSELKAMVRAPEGYAIVGADVDSEELWISSCMGDAQFGLHGATALGWMTLEGTKAAGTDLHSKTANILGISRDQAKVFNYSRIYGAGMRHAVLLLMQSNAGMLPDQAQKLAENLYSSTKGKNTHRTDIFGRKFWFGGTESYVFNKLEEIALSDRPQTPALGCGVTYALSKEYLPAEFGSDYMPSRINWVVQSSGVDYLHLLIVSMDHLIAKYNISARYLISVHDELRYLVAAEDRYRAALALQVANLWTRSLFAYKLGMDDLPQGVAFFSAVDVDHVLRKEVDMPCITPSQPTSIPPGESLNITQLLTKTSGGSLWKDGRAMKDEHKIEGSLEGYQEPDCLVHRAESAAFLRAQATTEFGEVKHLAQAVYGQKFAGGVGGGKRSGTRKRKAAVATAVGYEEGVDSVDWSEAIEQIHHSIPSK